MFSIFDRQTSPPCRQRTSPKPPSPPRTRRRRSPSKRRSTTRRRSPPRCSGDAGHPFGLRPGLAYRHRVRDPCPPGAADRPGGACRRDRRGEDGVPVCPVGQEPGRRPQRDGDRCVDYNNLIAVCPDIWGHEQSNPRHDAVMLKRVHFLYPAFTQTGYKHPCH